VLDSDEVLLDAAVLMVVVPLESWRLPELVATATGWVRRPGGAAHRTDSGEVHRGVLVDGCAMSAHVSQRVGWIEREAVTVTARVTQHDHAPAQPRRPGALRS
jgi:hypothetical protein